MRDQHAENADKGSRFVNVAVAAPIHHVLTYRIPVGKEDVAVIGRKVLVPLGKRKTAGYIAERAFPTDSGDWKEISAFHDEILPPENVYILLWASRYYVFPPGEALKHALPAGTRASSERFRLTAGGANALKQDKNILHVQGMEISSSEKEVLQRLKNAASPLTKNFLLRDTGLPSGILTELVRRGFLETCREAPPKNAQQEEIWITATGKLDEDGLYRLSKRSPRIYSLFMQVLESKEPVSLTNLRRNDKNARKRIRDMELKGLVSTVRTELFSDPFDRIDRLECRPVVLNNSQKLIVEELTQAASEFRPFLLHGVTGSGKTEIYLNLIGNALKAGRSALTLVPEIALTPQLAARFHARFPGRVAVLHSGLTQRERRDSWALIRAGKLDIVVGARSALFSPLSNVGVIVIDEEHDGSFKQQKGLRYHARDLALVKGRQEKATVVLGSATPSMESYANAIGGKYKLLELPNRATSRPLPRVEVLDLRRYDAVQGALTAPLIKALKETLEAKQQAIIFLNRRGFAPYLICNGCGSAVSCPNCSVSLTWHKARNMATCHYCGHSVITPKKCPDCKTPEPRPVGLGTEKLTQLLRELFAGSRVARLDRDSSSFGRMTQVLDAFRQRKVDILVGTQMVTKGHDFPGVTLVGVVLADHGLNFPDFRAAERTFQLLCQVAGRAGRGDEPGRVVIQTYNPNHHSIVCAQTHDFPGFYKQEFCLRQRLGYPPAGRLVALNFSGTDPKRVAEAAGKTALHAKSGWSGQGIEVLGPAEAPISRLKGKSRWHLLFKCATRKPVHDLVENLAKTIPKTISAEVKMYIDVDPLDMM